MNPLKRVEKLHLAGTDVAGTLIKDGYRYLELDDPRANYIVGPGEDITDTTPGAVEFVQAVGYFANEGFFDGETPETDLFIFTDTVINYMSIMQPGRLLEDEAIKASN